MPKFAANLTMLFGEQPFLDRFAAAKAAGFSGVEYLFPYDFDKAELREQLHQHGLTQVLHNLPAGNWGAGERGIAILPDRVEEFRDGVARAVDYAKALDCRQLNCLVGIAPDGADQDRSERGAGRQSALRRGCARQGRDQAFDRADQHDRHPRLLPEQDGTGASAHCGRALEQSVRAVRHLPHAGDGGRHRAQPAKASARIAHVQLADNPGRNEPGTGEINYPFLFRHLDAIGYRGWVGCEYKPRTTTVEGLGWHAALTADT